MTIRIYVSVLSLSLTLSFFLSVALLRFLFQTAEACEEERYFDEGHQRYQPVCSCRLNFKIR